MTDGIKADPAHNPCGLEILQHRFIGPDQGLIAVFTNGFAWILTLSLERTPKLKQGENVRIRVDMYLISHSLFTGKTFDTYTGLRSPNNTFWVALDEIVGRDKHNVKNIKRKKG